MISNREHRYLPITQMYSVEVKKGVGEKVCLTIISSTYSMTFSSLRDTNNRSTYKEALLTPLSPPLLQINPTHPEKASFGLPLYRCYTADMQFPVKWNAFSDRNGMLFSGLTEWLSDTNGMAQ